MEQTTQNELKAISIPIRNDECFNKPKHKTEMMVVIMDVNPTTAVFLHMFVNCLLVGVVYA